ncbi:MAG: hypothetical protein KBT10_02475 [Bacteroidales bacterium]|nr:hypothetical protein [Candidatus Sodaliphilus aphodohippi]
MKKILLSLLMLCTVVSAWSYETNNVVLLFNDETPSKTTNIETGISVQATPYTEDYFSAWKVAGDNALELAVPQGYVITGVEFEYSGFFEGDNINQCDCLIFNTENETWVQKDGKLDYFSSITFKAGSPAYISAVFVYYHKHTLTHHEAVAATCVATGMNEYWECSDCGKIYSDQACTTEVTNLASLGISVNSSNHNNKLEEVREVAATCTDTGTQHHWHCNACNHNYEDAQGQNQLPGDNVTLDINPKNHPEALEEHARVEATCLTAGNVHHWHCNHCNKNFEDEASATPITGNVVIPATNHKNKTFTEAVAPTADKEGNVAYWYCPDCDKHFGDAACTNELTEWVLAKLMNVLHIHFAGDMAPVETEHYMNTAKFNFTSDGDVIFTANGKSVTYNKEMIDSVKFSNGMPIIEFSAQEDPANKGDFYTTFYSSLEAYAVPENASAYTGMLETGADILHLTEITDGVIPAGTPVVLKSSSSSFSANTCDFVDGGAETDLLGTDVTIPAPDNSYALPGTTPLGMGLYPWNGNEIGANQAYLTIGELLQPAVIKFQIDQDTPTGIDDLKRDNQGDGRKYDVLGRPMNDDYKGIVIMNGKKILVK